MKKYFNYQINKVVTVKNLITIEYLNISSSFSYPREIHDFHEFAYVDSGNLLCSINGENTTLKQGDFLLIPPQTDHFYSAISGTPATIFIVCFRSNSEILTVFDKKIALDKASKMLVAEILSESKKAFCFPFKGRIRGLDCPTFGAQQLVENNIEKLLIYLVRNEIDQNDNICIVMNSSEFENSLVNDVIGLLKANVYSRITLDEISKQTF